MRGCGCGLTGAKGMLDDFCACDHHSFAIPKSPPFKPEPNGCGAKGDWFKDNLDLPPDISPAVKHCCDEHDKCWGTCGAGAINHMKLCNNEFSRCLKGSIVNWLYPLAVNLLGCKTYAKAQREACGCVSKKYLADITVTFPAKKCGTNSAWDILNGKPDPAICVSAHTKWYHVWGMEQMCYPGKKTHLTKAQCQDSHSCFFSAVAVPAEFKLVAWDYDLKFHDHAGDCSCNVDTLTCDCVCVTATFVGHPKPYASNDEL
jgi:hypothetical protein